MVIDNSGDLNIVKRIIKPCIYRERIMKNKLLISYMFFAFCFSAFPMGSEQPNSLIPSDKRFIYIDDDNNIWLAFNTYFNERFDQKLVLVSVMHLAEKQFYDEVEREINGKIVLVEGSDCSHLDSVNLKNEIERCGQPYVQLYDLPDRSQPFTILCISAGLWEQQKALHYSSPNKVIHADVIDHSRRSPLLKVMGDQKELKKALISLNPWISECVKHLDLSIIESPEVTKSVMSEAVNKFKKHSMTQIGDEWNYRAITDTWKENSHAADFPENPCPNNCSSCLRIFGANQVVKKTLKRTMIENRQSKEGLDIAIVYGVDHFYDIEAHLLSNGFKKLATDWHLAVRSQLFESDSN